MDIKLLAALTGLGLAVGLAITGWYTEGAALLEAASLRRTVQRHAGLIADVERRAMDKVAAAHMEVAVVERLFDRCVDQTNILELRMREKICGFAGPDPRRERDGFNLGGGDVLQPPEKGPIRTEAK